MDYNGLLNLGTDLGCRLMESGAEIYRVEDSVLRLMNAYQVMDAQVFAIPNCLIVGLISPEGQPITRITRIPPHGNDIGQLELCNDLCRHLCSEVPPLEQAQAQVDAIAFRRPRYSPQAVLLGYFIGAGFFTAFFGGGLTDALCGGLCGLLVGMFLLLLNRAAGANAFFRTLFAASLASLLSLLLVRLGVGRDLDAITIGTLMLLVPGMALTNAMREVMAGDLMSGLSHTTDALLTGVAIALGAGVGLAIGQTL